jgi:hypothetical protein
MNRLWATEHHEVLADFEYYEKLHKLQWASESIHYLIVCALSRRCSDCEICLKARMDVDLIVSKYNFCKRCDVNWIKV